MGNSKITIISNNIGLPGFEAEHGFSLLLEHDNEKILFDTGHGSSFKKNIMKLKIKLSEIDTLILSHGHYDHCGNISYVFKKANKVNTYIHPGGKKNRYSIHENRNPRVKNIGITRKNLKSLERNNVIYNSCQKAVDENVYITGFIPRLTTEDTGGPFFLDVNGEQIDNIEDDQAIWIEDKDGLIIITGCCHSGIINTVEYIKNISGIDRVKIIIGGLHLSNARVDRVNLTIQYINDLNLQALYPGHCTGEGVIGRFENELNCSVFNLFAGSIHDVS